MKRFLLIILYLISFNICYANDNIEDSQNKLAQVVQKFKDAVPMSIITVSIAWRYGIKTAKCQINQKY